MVLRNRLTLTGDIIAGTKCAPAAGKDKHSDSIVHLRLGNGLDQISLYRVSQTIQPLGRVELNPSDTRLSQRNLKARKTSDSHLPPPVAISTTNYPEQYLRYRDNRSLISATFYISAVSPKRPVSK